MAAQPIPSPARVDARAWLPVVRALAVRPTLWLEGLGLARRLARRGWWRAWPPIPSPPDAYLRFRLQTATGDSETAPVASDVVAYLRWCKDNRAVFA